MIRAKEKYEVMVRERISRRFLINRGKIDLRNESGLELRKVQAFNL